MMNKTKREYLSGSCAFRITKSHNRKIKGFTLIEVTLAMAIIAVGMVGVLALFPVGLQATKDAMGDNYSSEMADQFLHLIKMQCEIYESAGTVKDGWGEWITGDSLAPATGALQVSDTQPSTASFGTNNLDVGKVAKGLALFGDGTAVLNASTIDAAGIYYDGDTDGVDGENEGVFHVEARTGEFVDWSGVMYLWREPLRYDSDADGVDDLDIPYSVATRLCVEISWPAVKPYSVRQKRVYSIEIFNPNER